MNLKGSKIIVTGGSSGVGKSTARMLVEHGAEVLITGRNSGRLKKAANAIGCSWIEADVASEDAVEKTFQWVKDNWNNRLDVLINNAGLGEFSSVEDTPMESYHRVFSVNFFGPVMMVKKALPLMQRRGSGSIVNLASTSSMKGFPNGSAYAASKFALRGFTQSLVEEVRNQNIRVFQVNPSEVSTAFGNPEREERKETDNKLGPDQISQTIVSILQLPDKAFIPELSVWATNPKF